jgi:hypothetical protein
VFAL